MKEENKSNKQVLNALKKMRQRIAGREAAAEEHKHTEYAFISI